MSQRYAVRSICAYLVCAVAAVSLCACSTSTTVRAPDFGVVNDELSEHPAELTTTTSGNVSVHNPQLSSDSLRWSGQNGAPDGSIPISSVSGIARVDHWDGGLDGLEIGAAIGAGIGTIFGIVWMYDSASNIGGGSGWIAAGAVGGALGGGLVGFLTGVIIGHDYHYDLHPK